MPDNSNARFERIEAILEDIARRHHGLTETVELLAAMQRDNLERFRQNEERFASLLRIVESHEHRLDDLEA